MAPSWRRSESSPAPSDELIAAKASRRGDRPARTLATGVRRDKATTMTGCPRRAEFSCCSHDAKKAWRSRNSHLHRIVGR
jgi:hypothetical protein